MWRRPGARHPSPEGPGGDTRTGHDRSKSPEPDDRRRSGGPQPLAAAGLADVRPAGGPPADILGDRLVPGAFRTPRAENLPEGANRRVAANHVRPGPDRDHGPVGPGYSCRDRP